MNKERDEFLTVAIIGCRHENENKYGFCNNCNDFSRAIDSSCKSFSTWQGFGELWEWVQKQEWFIEFILRLWMIEYGYDVYSIKWAAKESIPRNFTHPNRFADAVYEYLKNKEN